MEKKAKKGEEWNEMNECEFSIWNVSVCFDLNLIFWIVADSIGNGLADDICLK